MKTDSEKCKELETELENTKKIMEAAYERIGCGCGGDHGLCNFCSKVVDDLQKALGK